MQLLTLKWVELMMHGMIKDLLYRFDASTEEIRKNIPNCLPCYLYLFFNIINPEP